MKIENGKVIYELEDCTCMKGKVYGYKACTVCNGTRKGVRGGKGKCRNCHYDGREIDTTKLVDCGRCNGSGKNEETRYSFLSQELWEKFSFRVERVNRKQGFVEQYIGLGVASCTDYGRAWESKDDDKLIEIVRKEDRITQVLKVVDENDNLAKEMLISVCPTGYTVLAVFEKKDNYSLTNQ